FVNTLALRTDLSGDPTFRELLKRVREGTLGAYEHQDLPFEKLVAELQPERSLSHAPLFQVMLTLQNADDSGGELPGLVTRGIDVGVATAKFDLSLTLSAQPDGLRGVLVYATDLFERETVRRMLGQLERLLERAASAPDARLAELDLLDEAERRLVVEEWNRTEAAYPADCCLHHLFEAQAERTPDAVALEWRDRRITYGELDARANRLARHLRRRGVRPEARVALCLERGAEMVVCMLGVLKAGGAYVPLDPASPPARLRALLADCGAAVLLTDEATRGRVAAPAGVAVVSVEGAADEIAAESAVPLEGGAGPGHLAYVIYTSGSTGTPKGVGVEHRSACNLVAAMVPLLETGPGARVLLLSPPHFDASVADIFSALCAGAALHVADGDDLLPGPALLERVRRDGITHAKLTPSALAAVPFAELPTLGTLVVGGEACGAELVERWGRGRRFVNVYGPTEATVRVSAAVCAPGAGRPAIGAPLANTRLYVLDASLRPLPVGVPGELCVGGVQVARGYLGRPALTAERFIPDPFSTDAGARLYRTGDRARWRPDGALEHLGRLDAQVKVRGFRIEPGEIEAVLRRRFGVRDCVVIAREDTPGDQRLVAYVVGDADEDTLRAHLRKSLPEYMVPAAFVSLDALPLTPNGKLDRRALPAPAYAGDEESYVAPRTPVEEVLAATWAEVLDVERVGAADDFFELGGHSLLATLVMARIRQLFGVGMPLRALFEGPTVAELAARVEAHRRAGVPALPPVVPVGRDRPLPLSSAQERLWFLHRLEPDARWYNYFLPIRLEGALDTGALERALGEIVRRHEALRTTFRETPGGPVQVIAPFAGFTLSVEDASALDEA
ncbi:MAG TPA: amino acid adenylation domain-containing protein, partial [Longimicrobium sp.]|nr:amino acid adenylation domain-containing protein [Longimicrobium sp.]